MIGIRIISIIAAASFALTTGMETVKGKYLERNNEKHTISVEVDGVVKVFTFDASTKFMDIDGKENAIIGRVDFPAWTEGPFKITIETDDGNHIASIRLPTRLLPPVEYKMTDFPVYRLEGKKLPPFNMTTTNGETITNASLRGKIVVLYFWASWCGPCKLLAPVIEDIHKKFASKGVLVIAAGCDEVLQGDSREDAAKCAAEHGLTCAITYDNKPYMDRIGEPIMYPCVVILDRSGTVRKVELGWAKDQGAVIQGDVKRILDEK